MENLPKEIEDKIKGIGVGLDNIDYDGLFQTVTRYMRYLPNESEVPKEDISYEYKMQIHAVLEHMGDHTDYSYLASRLLLSALYEKLLAGGSIGVSYSDGFSGYLHKAVDEKQLNALLLSRFDLVAIGKSITASRDRLFKYMGTKILMDRYLLRSISEEREILELPQWMWMRVAMGLSVKEKAPTLKAIELYTQMSELNYVPSTPTLFNSGLRTLHKSEEKSQLSSCYINTVPDSLEGIFDLYKETACLSKYAGGIGTSWTGVRASGSRIRGTNGKSTGIIPYIKIYNSIAVAVNQGGKRKGAIAVYLEVWHRDIKAFCELKKNTGDERCRTYELNTAVWIPDLFMKRVRNKGKWTLFCPSEVPKLLECYGQEFEIRYEEYEHAGLSTAIEIEAVDLWRQILTMNYESGGPWITFKDAINLRNPQDHVGMVRSSNLCTEITLNTSDEETAVCNLGSINLSNMYIPRFDSYQLDRSKLKKTIKVAVRALDNVIDLNYYPSKKAELSNTRNRPIGLGVMGFQDVLYKLRVPFDSEEAINLSDILMEEVSYRAIRESCKLARERGVYDTYKGSKWSRGLLLVDTIDELEKSRKVATGIRARESCDWEKLRKEIKWYGMRNSNVIAIAPTATISNIAGVYPCVEPIYKNYYVKENLSGKFVVLNEYMVEMLSGLGLWDNQMQEEIKDKEGSIKNIDRIPADIKALYKEAFDIPAKVIIEQMAERMRWIDQSISCNLFIKTTSGKKLGEIYMYAWEKGLKTTYYLRTKGATQITRSSSVIASEECEVC